MGKRKVTILDTASDAVAEVAFFIEGKGMPETAKKLLIMHLNFFKVWAMKELNITHAHIRFGRI